MITEREALKLALEALEEYARDFGSSDLSVKAMYVGRQALAQRTWVGLTPENYNEIFLQARTGEHAVHLAEAKLKQKNGYAVGNIGLYMEALK